MQEVQTRALTNPHSEQRGVLETEPNWERSHEMQPPLEVRRKGGLHWVHWEAEEQSWQLVM
jgi:hypothetical protein